MAVDIMVMVIVVVMSIMMVMPVQTMPFIFAVAERFFVEPTAHIR